jgi:hypothetical protein
MFTKFNAHVFLESERPDGAPANAANPAKASIGETPTLATLAAFSARSAWIPVLRAARHPTNKNVRIAALAGAFHGLHLYLVNREPGMGRRPQAGME